MLAPRSMLFLLLTSFLLVLGGCGSDGGTSKLPGGSDNTGSPDLGKADTGSPDPGKVQDPGPAGGKDPGGVDPGAQDPGPLPDVPPTREQIACGLNLDASKGTKLMGEICSSDEECATGYCYDEWFMGWQGGKRFCTVACNGCQAGKQLSCGDFDRVDGLDTLGYTCLILRSSCHVKIFGSFDIAGVCLPRCQSIETCTQWFPGAGYTTCATPKLKGDDCAGLVGVNKVCHIPQP